MRKNILKMGGITLATIFSITSILTGCTSSDANVSTDPQAKEGTAEVKNITQTESKLKPYKIDFYMQAKKSKDLDMVQDAMNKILKDKINATVELHPIDSGTWKDKTKLMFVSGDKIDVISSANWLDYSSNVASKAYQDLTELLPKYGQGILELMNIDYIKGTSVNGKIYGIPVLKEQGYSAGYVFNKTLVDKYQFDLSTIKTYKDVEPMLKVIKENEPDITPLCQSGLNVAGTIVMNKYYETLGSDFGGALLIESDDTKLVEYREHKEFVDSLYWSHEMWEKGYVNKSSLTDNQSQSPMVTGNGFVTSQMLKPGKDSELSVTWGYPVVQVDLMDPYTPANQATGFMESIGVTSEDPERAMMFLNLLYTDKELLNTLVFGIEGKHYEKVDANTIKYPSGLDSKTVGWVTKSWQFGNQLNNYLFENEDPNKWKNFKAFNDSSRISKAMGFTFDSSPVATEIAACTNVKAQYQGAIAVGAVDPATALPEFMEKLKAAGSEKIIAEKQRQLDEWIKANK